MPPKDKQNTLLGLLGNLLGFDVPKSMTSKDLPTGHEAINSLIEKQDAYMSKSVVPAGTKIFGKELNLTQRDLYSMTTGVGGFAKQLPVGGQKLSSVIKQLKHIIKYSPAQRRELVDEIMAKEKMHSVYLKPVDRIKIGEELAMLKRVGGKNVSGKQTGVGTAKDIAQIERGGESGFDAADIAHKLNKSLLEGLEEFNKSGFVSSEVQSETLKSSSKLLELLERSTNYFVRQLPPFGKP